MPGKHIVFDVVGTLVSFEAFYAGIAAQLSTALAAHGLTPTAFGYAWQTAAELDFTFLSLSGRNTPYKNVLSATFYRTFHHLGCAGDPRAIATDAKRDACVEAYGRLSLRPGAAETIQILRDGGFTVWLLSTADKGRLRGYFAGTGIEIPEENMLTCLDDQGALVVKPAKEAYRAVLARPQFAEEGAQRWFAAAHMWDVSAARVAGFKGAYAEVLEGKETCEEVFGGLDVVGKSLVDMAEGVVKASA